MAQSLSVRANPRDAVTRTQDAPQKLTCRLCTCGLDQQEEDDLERRICASCKDRPEARRLGIGLAPLPPRRPHAPGAPKAASGAREFTAAELSLISKVHHLMPVQQLLDLLNERLVCDLGPDAARYTHEQLQGQIANMSPAGARAGGHDWPSLRKLLAQARRAGVLSQITEQVIDDFAVVFSLNPKQVMALKDILLQPAESSQ
jgi:hypothetical protein